VADSIDLAAVAADLAARGCVAVEAELRGASVEGAALARVIARSTHLLGAIEPAGALADGLASRIDEPALADVVARHQAATPGPRLRRRWPLPEAVDPALRRVLVGHADTVTACAPFPDGARLVTGSSDGTARIWDVATGRTLHVLAHDPARTQWVRDCAVAPDGAWLATSPGPASAAWIWDAGTGALRGRIEDVARDLSISRDGTRLARGGDGCAVVHDVATGARCARIEVSESDVCGWLADDVTLILAGRDGRVRAWRTDTGDLRVVIDRASHLGIRGALAPDGRWLATEAHPVIEAWDTATWTPRDLGSPYERVHAAVGALDDGWLLCKKDGLRVRDAGTGALRAAMLGPWDEIMVAAAAPDGRWVAGAAAATVWIWEVAAARAAAARPQFVNCRTCAVAPDGSWVATGESDGVRVRDPATGAVTRVLHAGVTPSTSAVAPDGSWLAIDDGEDLLIWNMPAGELRHRLDCRVLEGLELISSAYNWVLGCAAAPDGSWLATVGEDGFVRIWDAATGERRACFEADSGRRLYDCLPLPDGSLLYGDSSTTYRYDVARERHGATVRLPGSAISPDGARVAAADHKGISIWTTATGAVERTMVGHDGHVSGCAFSPDGALLASTGVDRTVRIWSVATGEQRAALRVDCELHACRWLPGDGLCVVGTAGAYGFDVVPAIV
jgi:WD40 repeat protein